MWGEIIDKLKAANGPDYAIDLEIARMRGVTIMQHNPISGGNDEATLWRFTEKLDHAVTLIPQGVFWSMAWGRLSPHEPLAGAAVFTTDDPDKFLGVAEGEHLALCVCIAALEARDALGLPAADGLAS